MHSFRRSPQNDPLIATLACRGQPHRVRAAGTGPIISGTSLKQLDEMVVAPRL